MADLTRQKVPCLLDRVRYVPEVGAEITCLTTVVIGEEVADIRQIRIAVVPKSRLPVDYPDLLPVKEEVIPVKVIMAGDRIGVAAGVDPLNLPVAAQKLRSR